MGHSGTSDGPVSLPALAQRDALTGLPNRALFERELEAALERARREGSAAALFYLDLNDFRLVNDGLGHSAGDELLRRVAARLGSACRAGDVLARQGGDEFLLLVPGIEAGAGQSLDETAATAAAAIARKLAEALEPPFLIGDAEFLIDASIGVSLFPADAADVEGLQRHADTAMYRAKQDGVGFCRYEPDERDPLQRLALTARLARALDRAELELHYQPIFKLDDDSLSGAEALVRWRDPARGLIPPLDFIPVAERTGMIDRVGDHVVDLACGQIRRWALRGLYPNVGINVSPRQLRRPGFPARLARRLDRLGVEPRRVIVEITESAWTVEAARSVPAIQELRSHGLVVAIDDFGAGYSSLSRLRALPVDIIKVDRAFMDGIPHDPQAAAVVTAIMRLAEACECEVVAEGVETAEQLDFLRAHGCQRVQGFHLGRPVPAEELTPLLAASLPAGRRAA